MSSAEPSSDPRLARLVSRVLIVGLYLAVSLLVIGVILILVRPETPVPGGTSVVGMPRALAALEPGGFFTLGLLVLLATPAARLVTLMVGFAQRRIWLFSGVALLVLAIIVAAAYLGLKV